MAKAICDRAGAALMACVAASLLLVGCRIDWPPAPYPDPEPPEDVHAVPAETFDLNQAAGFPAGGNTVKLHDACMDDSRDVGVAVGILTSYAAVFDSDSTIAYVPLDAPDEPGSPPAGKAEGLKNVLCADGVAFVASEKLLVKIDLDAREVAGRVDLGAGRMPVDSLIFDAPAHRVAYPLVDGGLAILDSDSMRQLGTLPVQGRQHVLFLPDGTILAVDLEEATATLFEGEGFGRLSSSRLQGVGEATHAAYDRVRDDLWVVDRSTVAVYDAVSDPSVPSRFGLPFPPKTFELEGDHAVAVQSDKNIVVGSKLAFVDVAARRVTKTLDASQRFNRVDIVPDAGLGWFACSEENNVTALDLTTGDVAGLVDVGNTAEYGFTTVNGRTWVSNRLGGSTLVRLDATDGGTQEVGTGRWPVGAAFSPSSGRVFTYDMLDGTISVFDEATAEHVATWEIGLAGRTDAIGDLALDDVHGRLYALLPEAGKVAVVDTGSGDVLGIMEVESPRARLSGPGTLDVAVHEATGTLFVYSASTHTVYAYDGERREEAGRASVPGDLVPYPLHVDEEGGTVYVGPHAYAVDDLAHQGTLDGTTRVVAVDRQRGTILAAGEQEGVPTLTTLSLAGQATGEAVPSGPAGRIHPTYAYDAASGTVFAYSMVENVVRTFTLRPHSPTRR